MLIPIAGGAVLRRLKTGLLPLIHPPVYGFGAELFLPRTLAFAASLCLLTARHGRADKRVTG